MYQFKPITDESKVKDVIVLGIPTCSSTLLGALFYNQIAALNNIRDDDEKEERERNEVS